MDKDYIEKRRNVESQVLAMICAEQKAFTQRLAESTTKGT